MSDMSLGLMPGLDMKAASLGGRESLGGRFADVHRQSESYSALINVVWTDSDHEFR